MSLPINRPEDSFGQTPDANDIVSPEPNVIDPAQPTSLISPEFRSVDPRNIDAEVTSGLIFSAAAACGALVGTIVLFFSVGLGWILYASAAGAFLVVALLVIAALYWPRIEHRHMSYRIDEEGLEIRRGVFWRHQNTVPLGRVQHADVSQGPLQRMFGVGTLVVHTAGTQGASVELPGLGHEQAVALRDLIVHQRKGQDAV